MSLDQYKKKRTFENTPEPAGAESKENLFRFVIQRHEATRLHYDFRLELDGVLKSWAVPKGPSLNPTDKRLAMMVEDHPVEYITFKGTIPPDNYGAGKVAIWDHGTFQPVNEKHEPLTEKEAMTWLEGGQLKFSMKGRKLKGEFALVKLKKDEKGNAWLLIKHRDEHAVDGYDSEDFVAGKPKKSAVVKKAAAAKKKP